MIFFPTKSFEGVDVDDEDEAAAKKVLFGLERAAARRQRLLEREEEEMIFRDEAVDGCRAANNIFLLLLFK